MKFSLNFFLKKKKTPINIIYIQRGPIQSGLSMYTFSVKKFYLLSCKDILTLEVHTHLLIISKKISITQKCNNL